MSLPRPDYHEAAESAKITKMILIKPKKNSCALWFSVSS
jgi:hypothetical protein